MGRYRTINTDLNRQYRNDLNANFAQIEADILGQQNFTEEMKNSLLNELARIERESKERDNALVKQNLEVLLQSIEDAKANANNAATNANTKATHAQTHGDYAKAQGDYAKNQGDYAKTKGDYANEKAIQADQAASNANQEASNLSQLKINAVEATQNANTATSNANNSATHAQQQGDYAKIQADRAKDVVDGTGLLTQTDIGKLVAGFNGTGQVLDKNGNVVEGKVKSVNGVAPDDNGNITVPTFSGNYNDLINKPALKTVATTGSYNDLTNKPTIQTPPTKTSQLTNDSGFITSAPVDSLLADLRKYCIIQNSVQQSISSGLAVDYLAETITNYNSANFASISNNKVVLTKGIYRIDFYAYFDSNGTGSRQITLDGHTVNSTPLSLGATRLLISKLIEVTSTKTLQLNLYQTSGVTLNLLNSSSLIISKVASL